MESDEHKCAEVVIPVEEHDFSGTEIISINGRDQIDSFKERYPNIEVIVGQAQPEDEPVKLNLIEMEHDRKVIIDAATNTVLGKRIDKLEKPVRFPFPAVMFVIGLMTASAVWMYLGQYIG